jgi:hypothetical protein
MMPFCIFCLKRCIFLLKRCIFCLKRHGTFQYEAFHRETLHREAAKRAKNHHQRTQRILLIQKSPEYRRHPLMKNVVILNFVILRVFREVRGSSCRRRHRNQFTPAGMAVGAGRPVRGVGITGF